MADEERSEPFEQLEERVNRRVQEALSGLQREIRDRLKRAGDQLVGELDRELGEAASGLPSSFLPREELAPLAAEAEAAGSRQLLGHLLAAYSALDAAGSQRAVLDTLIAEGQRFADRTAVLLTGDAGYRLWGAGGWGDDAPSEVSLPWGQAGPWSPERAGSGTSPLTTNDCAPLCSRLEGAMPRGGVLVPLILRDRLAAVVYADHSGGAFFAEALQALTWAAALALEALPFRERATTPTLHVAGEVTAAPVLAPEAVEVEEAEEYEVVEAVAAPGFEIEDDTVSLADEDDQAEVDLGGDDGGDGDDLGLGAEAPSSDVGELEISEPAEEDEGLPEPPTWEAPELDTAVDEADDEGDELVIEDFDDAVDGDLYGGGDELEIDELEVEEDVLHVEEDDADEGGDEDEVELVEEAPEEEPSAAAEPAADAMATDRVPRIAGFERGDDEAAAEPPASAEPPAPPELPEADRPPGLETAAASSPAAAPAAPTSEGSPQVAPPTDHRGPGLAFGADSDDDAEGDGARHEEARRLARLLVSEIRLYNEDLVEEGRRNQDIYQRLKEDIDRSRQIYEERIDAGLREDTDYFYEELVRNLGGGDASTLGI